MTKTIDKKKKPEKETLTDELTAVIEEIADTDTEEKEKKTKGEVVTLLEDDEFLIGERKYRLVHDHREAFDPERLGERYSDILSRYDYIVADWGYEQLRLKGFFAADNRKAQPEQRIDTLEDYLYEYCNFGCAYFVIERIGGKREKTQRQKKRKKVRTQAHIEEKREPVKKDKKKPVIKQRQDKKNTTSVVKEKTSSFTIRQREE
ncbi:hypothetical protein RU97_GL002530 [Enterococcus canis]|uniref:Transcriptional regulator n=1 Tax=Enterococcus canis TaxID=214095 RepID=A0A1L8RD75_9ENTE|nr:YutD family protein [Enterococcus canis]OJG17740.1 hypothetical protein RU97_GL002530 [Enterococcus canis]